MRIIVNFSIMLYVKEAISTTPIIFPSWDLNNYIVRNKHQQVPSYQDE